MISCENLFQIFKNNDLTFFTGVPDSTFKDWMKFLNDEHGNKLTNIIATNECESAAISVGYYLATGKIGVVYMQNSGLGKTVNPTTSLLSKEVYSIPAFYMIGWRGEPDKKDEPQHKMMGRVMLPLLDCLEIPYKILPDNVKEAETIIREVKQLAEQNSSPAALIIKEKTLEEYTARKSVKTNYEMSREDAIKTIVNNLRGDEVIVSTTGKTSRELFEYREALKQNHDKDFLTVGSMGCSSAIGFGIASQSNKSVIIFDGDGAVLMQMGTLATIGNYAPKNFYHIVFDNSSYDSTGGQPTISPSVDFAKIALACGYKKAEYIETKQSLKEVIKGLKTSEGPKIVIIKVNKGARKNLGRPTTTTLENKKSFMEFLNIKNPKIFVVSESQNSENFDDSQSSKTLKLKNSDNSQKQ